ncbi:MAG: hypothetical protein H5T73_10895 [Actinobacteria bacterium]|nr:hypothetical protein [Actinomycetota bacterium]
MVQVDVFWSYGIGSSFALAAFRQLRRLKAENEVRRWKLGWKKQPQLEAGTEGAVPEAGSGGLQEAHEMAFQELVSQLKANGFKPGEMKVQDLGKALKVVKKWAEKYSDAFNNEYFLKNLLFLSLLFVPSGSVLLWSNPNWETMQVGSYETIPQWLVGIFTTTNVTQGILGFLVTYNLLMKGKYYQAAMQTVLAYLGFFFILANGWDNKGYQRFFSRNREAFEDWKWSNIFGWAVSDVAAILLVYGAAFLPLMYYWITKWFIEGEELEKGNEGEVDIFEDLPRTIRKFIEINVGIFGGTLLPAVIATFLIHHLGWAKGLSLTAGMTGLLISKWGLANVLLKRIMGIESLEDVPVEELARRALEAEKELAPATA